MSNPYRHLPAEITVHDGDYSAWKAEIDSIDTERLAQELLTRLRAARERYDPDASHKEWYRHHLVYMYLAGKMRERGWWIPS